MYPQPLHWHKLTCLAADSPLWPWMISLVVTFCQSFSWGNWSSGQPNLFLLCNLWWKRISLFYYLTMVYCRRGLIWARNIRKHIDQQGGQCWIRWYRTPKERPTWVQVWDPPRCILLFLIPGTGRPLLIELFRLRSQQNQRPHHEHDSSLSNWMSSVIVSFHVEYFFKENPLKHPAFHWMAAWDVDL